MITFKQITKSSEIVALKDYYVIDVRTTGPNPAVNAIDSLSMLQVVDDEIVQEAVVRIAPDSDREASPEGGYYRAQQVADSMARLLIGQVIVAEPSALQFLRALLERYDHEGELRFVPVGKLASALFPEAAADSVQEIARQLEIPEQDNAGLLRTVYFEYEIFIKCCMAIGGPKSRRLRKHSAQTSSESRKASRTAPKRISSRTLKRWAKNVWSVSPWVVVATIFVVVFVLIVRVPRKQSNTIDRNVAPVNYLVLSWDQPGKYGSKPRLQPDGSSAIEFRVPYGVYNVLNNNSIPVTLSIISDMPSSDGADAATEEALAGQTTGNEDDTANGTTDSKSTEVSSADTAGTADAAPQAAAASSNPSVSLKPAESSAPSATELRGSTASVEDDEESDLTTITMRPNSNRQITIDIDQYLTLSDDAKDLILFYLSEVPEEKESDTTGQDNGNGSRVVYAYVKGTEVRFRKSPSLEGAIIDSMQNGQQVQVLGVTGEWTHVQVQGEKGYIFSQFLTSEDPQAAAYAAKLAEQSEQQADSTSGLPQMDSNAGADEIAVQENAGDVPADGTIQSAEPVSDGSSPTQ